jgi:hypothetical protein
LCPSEIGCIHEAIKLFHNRCATTLLKFGSHGSAKLTMTILCSTECGIIFDAAHQKQLAWQLLTIEKALREVLHPDGVLKKSNDKKLQSYDS